MLGIWLLSGAAPFAAWGAALGCMAAMAGVSAAAFLRDEASCGCFGAAPVRPSGALAFDVGAVLALICFRPIGVSISSSHERETIHGKIAGVSSVGSRILVPSPRDGVRCVRWSVLVFFAAAVAGSFLANGAHTGLMVSSGSLDIGDVWDRDGISHTVMLLNETSRPIEIERLKSSCKCTDIEPDHLVVPPRQSRDVHLLLNLAGARGARARATASAGPVPLSLDLLAFRKGTAEPVRFILSGRLHTAIDVKPRAIHFSAEKFLDRSGPSEDVEVVCAPGVTGFSATCDPPFATVTANCVSKDQRAGSLHVVTVRPNDNLPLGPFDFDVRFRVNAGSDAFFVAPLRVSGVVADDIEVLPSRVALGDAPLGACLSDRIVVASRRHEAFFVNAARDGDAACGVTLTTDSAFAETHVLDLKVAVDCLGEASRRVDIPVVMAAGRRRSVPLLVSYRGSQATVSARSPF